MPHLSSMGNVYRIVIDVQYGHADECDKLYDGKGYGTVLPMRMEKLLLIIWQWDSDEWTDDDIL